MSIAYHYDRIPSLTRRNRERGLFYLRFIATGGYTPTPPNPNVVGYMRLTFAHVWEEPEPEVGRMRPGLGIEFVIFPPTATVPNLVGLLYPNASTLLANLSLSASQNPQPVADGTTPYLTVTAQSPDAGTSVGQGTVVNLTTQSLTLVPFVTGQTQAQGEVNITAAFLAFAVTQKVSTTPGIILSQDQSGSQVLPGTVINIVVGISGDGFRVQAVTAGWYNGTYYNVGDVFDLLAAADFSDASQNYEAGGGEYAAGWMTQVNAQTQATEPDGNATFPAVDPNRRFVE